MEDAAARHRQREDRTRSAGTGNARIADRVTEPQVRAGFADDVDRANQIGPERRRPGEGTDVGEDVERIATLRLDDA